MNAASVTLNLGSLDAPYIALDDWVRFEVKCGCGLGECDRLLGENGFDCRFKDKDGVGCVLVELGE
jgi:hypothetical protein